MTVLHSKVRGGALEISFGANTNLPIDHALWYSITATNPSLVFGLPNHATKKGVPFGLNYILHNPGATTWTFADQNGQGIVQAVAQGEVYEVHLYDDRGTLKWLVIQRQILAA